jgi:hypothetical protein
LKHPVYIYIYIYIYIHMVLQHDAKLGKLITLLLIL